MTSPPSPSPLDLGDVEVAVIGAGFSGLGMAIRLREAGIEDFVVLERGTDVGGTWWANTYPGWACDVTSHLYAFSFALKPEWSQTYSTQPAIRAYMRGVVERFDLRRNIRLGHEVRQAAWDEDASVWELETSHGRLRARVLVTGMGPLTEPKIPDLPGLDSFEGPVVHSARWDHSVELEGKRVASVGTGASAIQYVPAIAPEVQQLHVIQRTPPWVMPHSGRPISKWERRIFRTVPGAQRALRGGIYAARELLVLGFVKQPKGMKLLERIGRRHRERGLGGDPALIAKATP